MQQLNPPIALPQPNIFPLLNTFFEQYDLHECHREVWNLATAFFSQPDYMPVTWRERANTAYFCSKMNELFMGLHLVWDCWKQSTASVDEHDRID